MNTESNSGVRARDLGISLDGTPGAANAITDVPGIEVGYVTLRPEDRSACTGVTAILPRGRAGVGEPCAAGTFSLNGNGEMTGRTWIEESGQFATPILLTNSHAVGAAHAGMDAWMADVAPDVARRWMLPVVAETWDGYLNNINEPHVTPETARRALDAATGGPLAEGSVGGGTGMNCYGFKGGTGTASRRVPFGAGEYTVGVLTQANFGSRRELRIDGRPVGRASAAPCPLEETNWLQEEVDAARVPGGAGSVIVIVATDAPLLPGQLKALARRVPLGLARTGTTGGHFSGDIFLAFSTGNDGGLRSDFPVPGREQRLESIEHVPWGDIDPFYEATVQAVEESVLNALLNNEDVEGRDGHFSPALPHHEVLGPA